jgi:hypothetical protein
MVGLAEILRQHWPSYRKAHAACVLPSHEAAVRAILRCRTPELGGQVYRCPQCAHTHFAYHSCNHRACPQCGHHEATAWLDQQKTKLLPVPYYLITFTVPGLLRPFIRHEQKLWYGLLFQQSSATCQDVAQRDKYLGAQLGLLGVLQTWTRDLHYHPHVHYLVPGGGITPDGLRWKRPTSAKAFLPENVLSARFRSRLKQQLQTQHPELFARIPPQVWKQKWVVDVRAVGRGEGALKYLSAYIYKTAITSTRLIACDEHNVTFRYREAKTGQWQTRVLPAHQFLHRFLQHILPAGFQRVRYYGWLCAAAHKRWGAILALLDWKPPQLNEPDPLPPPLCPKCDTPLEWLKQLLPPPPDTS